MANSTQVALELPERETLHASNVKATDESIKFPTNAVKTAARTALIFALVTLALYTIIPILQLYIGNRYVDKCPVNKYIPQYLVVAGAVTLAVIILGVIQAVLAYKAASEIVSAVANDTNYEVPVAKIIGGSALICCTLSASSILFVFLLAWFIAGCYWIYSVWDIVQYDDPSQGTYCHQFLYRFAFWILFISVIFKILSILQPHLKKLFK